jgi:hypothetical protein
LKNITRKHSITSGQYNNNEAPIEKPINDAKSQGFN